MSGATACPRLVNFPFLFAWRIESSELTLRPTEFPGVENLESGEKFYSVDNGTEFFEIGYWIPEGKEVLVY